MPNIIDEIRQLDSKPGFVVVVFRFFGISIYSLAIQCYNAQMFEQVAQTFERFQC